MAHLFLCCRALRNLMFSSSTASSVALAFTPLLYAAGSEATSHSASSGAFNYIPRVTTSCQ